MKKRLTLLVIALALLVGCLALSALAADTKTGYCEACKQTVTWEPMVYGTVASNPDAALPFLHGPKPGSPCQIRR